MKLLCKILGHKTPLKNGDIVDMGFAAPKKMTLTARCLRCHKIVEYALVEGVVQ